jgi:hypothetical protein
MFNDTRSAICVNRWGQGGFLRTYVALLEKKQLVLARFEQITYSVSAKLIKAVIFNEITDPLSVIL